MPKAKCQSFWVPSLGVLAHDPKSVAVDFLAPTRESLHWRDEPIGPGGRGKFDKFGPSASDFVEQMKRAGAQLEVWELNISFV